MNERLKHQLLLRVAGAFALAITACSTPQKTDEYQDCYDVTGFYNPSRGHSNELHGDQFIRTKRVCYLKGTPIEQVNCPDDWADLTVIRGYLVPNTCKVTPV